MLGTPTLRDLILLPQPQPVEPLGFTRHRWPRQRRPHKGGRAGEMEGDNEGLRPLEAAPEQLPT